MRSTVALLCVAVAIAFAAQTTGTEALVSNRELFLDLCCLLSYACGFKRGDANRRGLA